VARGLNDNLDPQANDHLSFFKNKLYDYIGMRRLLLEEIVHLRVGDFFYIVIPPAPTRTRTDEDRTTKKNIDAFLKRCVSCAFGGFRNAGSTSLSPREILEASCGREQKDGRKEILLRCKLVSYPHRDDYSQCAISNGDVQDHVTAGG